ncbi:hypothetical protein LX32DRAFT_68058 [Colletotrichum zoysiae]|uniref:Uncharacterized protein n=1 Tax=Colletotrichum zoysiae TaxID=1216348 RepID=A0AAD9HAD5_9PEZI|nr:hypothetical protein LX32DRAFT_68058 [Colletotrichum zoysiae]
MLSTKHTSLALHSYRTRPAQYTACRRLMSAMAKRPDVGSKWLYRCHQTASSVPTLDDWLPYIGERGKLLAKGHPSPSPVGQGSGQKPIEQTNPPVTILQRGGCYKSRHMLSGHVCDDFVSV